MRVEGPPTIPPPPPIEDVGAPVDGEGEARPHFLRRAWRRCRSGRLPGWWIGLAFVAGLAIGAAVLATFQASGAIPPPPVNANVLAEASSDIILNVREPYLTKVAQQRAEATQGPVRFENPRVNVLPGDRLRVVGDVPFMGQRFQAAALMTVGVADRRVKLQVRDVQIGNLRLPMDLDAAIAQPINAELARLVEEGQFDVIDVATAEDRLVVRLVAAPTPAARPPR